MSCIPEFHLPEEIVQKETALLARIGVEIIYNTRVGRDISLEEINEKYNAVVVATGTQASKRLGILGEDAKNIYNALDYLKEVRENKNTLKPGKKVLVIGGGNTALNVAQTAKRLGAEEVRIACLENCDNMPAYKWEVADALEEGVIIEYGWGPAQFLVEDGQGKGAEFKRCCSVFDKEGRFAPLFSSGETQVFYADTIIVAVGQEMDPELNLGSLEVKAGFIVTDPVTKQTSQAKVFAAGDIIVGIKSVADAMAQGREAAISVERYLQGVPLDFGRDSLAACDLDFTVDLSKAEIIPRVCAEKLAGAERVSFKELEKGITKEQALMEAKRCLSCGEPYGKFRTCWSCLPCEVECPEEALYVKIPYLMR